MPIQHVQEELNIAYASAVIAKAGYSADITRRDYGVDLSVRRIQYNDGEFLDMGSIVDFQLKASINWTLEEENVVYDLEATAYNKLVRRYLGATIPCILVVLCLPRDCNEWLVLDEECLLLRKCCYWYYIKEPLSPNVSSVRIRIPREQLFTPECVDDLIVQIHRGDFFK
jgi:hypothetical protein